MQRQVLLQFFQHDVGKKISTKQKQHEIDSAVKENVQRKAPQQSQEDHTAKIRYHTADTRPEQGRKQGGKDPSSVQRRQRKKIDRCQQKRDASDRSAYAVRHINADERVCKIHKRSRRRDHKLLRIRRGGRKQNIDPRRHDPDGDRLLSEKERRRGMPQFMKQNG